jgi:hypothetical protein
MRHLAFFATFFSVSALLGACSDSTTSQGTPLASIDAGSPETSVEPAAPAPDPTGWKGAGDLHEARALPTATLLADGRVLVVGGEDTDYGMLASVEIFDPATGTFEEAAPLPAPRDHHTATLLAGGEVLVTGGGQGSEISLPTGEATLASALLFDPTAKTWRETGSMKHARAGHRAVRLDDGRVLVVGGGDTIGYPCANNHPNCNVAASLDSAEIYDPSTGEWTETASLAQARLGFNLTKTPAGVIASGGAADNKGLESVEVFDSGTGTWKRGPKLTGQRLYHAGALLGGKLVVAGGKIANVQPITSVDILDEAAAKWRSGASLDEARTGSSLVALQSGNGLLVAGNDQLGTQFLADAALYDPTADRWTALEPLAKGRYSQAAVLLTDGSVLVVGGRNADGVVARAERSVR